MMKHTFDLIERYIHDVARRLPKRTRGDVAAELRSSLGEAFDAAVADFNRESGRMARDDDRETLAADLVKKFGPPAALAASYRTGPQWLIGPELYPAFLRVLKIVSAVIVILVILSVVVDTIENGGKGLLVSMINLTFGGLVSDLVAAMGWVVLVFWIVQATSWHSRGDATSAGRSADVFTNAAYCGPDADSWDPRQLPKVDDPDVISRSGTMIEIGIMLALLVLFSVFPRAIGASVSVNDERGWIALLGPGFLENRQLLYVGFVGVAVVDLMLLRHNRWTMPARALDLAFNALFVVVLVPMVAGGEIIAVQAPDLVVNGWSPEAAENLSRDVFPVLDMIMRVVFAGIIVAIVAHTISRGVTLAKVLGR